MPNRKLAEEKRTRTWKVIKHDWDVTKTGHANDETCVVLTHAQRDVFLGLTEYLRGVQRWYNFDATYDQLQEWVDDLDKRLMGECPVSITDIRVENCQLEVQYDDSETWTPIGDLTQCAAPAADYTLEMTDCDLELQADGIPVSSVPVQRWDEPCTFANPVKIMADEARKLELQIDGPPAVDDGTTLLFGNVENYGDVIQPGNEIVAINAVRTNVSPPTGRFELYAMDAGTFRRICAFAENYHWMYLTANQVGGLRVAALNEKLAGAPMLRLDRAGSNLLFAVNYDGETYLTKYADTGTLYNAFTLRANMPGVVGAGTAMRWQANSSTASNRWQGWIGYMWEIADDATRSGKVEIVCSGWNEHQQIMAGTHHVDGPQVGFLGRAPRPRFDMEFTVSQWNAMDASDTAQWTILEGFGFINLSITPDPPECTIDPPQGDFDWAIEYDFEHGLCTDWVGTTSNTFCFSDGWHSQNPPIWPDNLLTIRRTFDLGERRVVNAFYTTVVLETQLDDDDLWILNRTFAYPFTEVMSHHFYNDGPGAYVVGGVVDSGGIETTWLEVKCECNNFDARWRIAHIRVEGYGTVPINGGDYCAS